MDRLNTWFESLSPWLLTNGVRILVILFLAFVIHRISSTFISKTVRLTVRSKSYQTENDERRRENTLTGIFTWTMTIAIILVTTLMILQLVGIAIAPILASLGIVGLAVGFGGQYLIRDIITGLFIILENQYRIGDVVDFDGTSGEVIEITLRLTTLRDADGVVHHVPHGEIKRVSNMTKGFSKINMDIKVPFDADLDQVQSLINEAGNSIMQDDAWKSKLITAPQYLRIDSFQDSWMTIKIVGETKPGEHWGVAGEVRKRVKLALDQAGIHLPYPVMVVRQPDNGSNIPDQEHRSAAPGQPQRPSGQPQPRGEDDVPD